MAPSSSRPSMIWSQSIFPASFFCYDIFKDPYALPPPDAYFPNIQIFFESYCSTCLECLLYPHNNLLQFFSIKIPMECLHHARHYVRCEGEKWWHHSWHPHFNLHISSKVNSCDNLSDPHNHNWYPTILSAHVILITSLLYCNSLKFLLVSSLIVYFWY